MTYERVELPLARLRLNKENDRHGPLGSEQECIQWMLNNLAPQIRNLAKDVAEHGLSPIEGILAFPDPESDGDYIIWEGNRRLTALKLLDDPNRCHDEKKRRVFTDIRRNAKVPIPDKLEVTVAPSVEDADRLIELRHQGPQEGVGTLQWDGSQKTRHLQRLGKKGRYAFSHQVLDSVVDRLDKDLRDKVTGQGFAISTFDRLLGNPDVRNFLGIASEDGVARRFLREGETLKGVKKLLTDIAEGMPVRDVYTKEQQKEYISSFSKSDTPDQKKTLKDSVTFVPPKPGKRQPSVRSRPVSTKRAYLIPQDVRYRIYDNRLNSIYKELKSLDVASFANATAVLMRVFLELGVDLYIENHKVSATENDKLSVKVQKVLKDMEANNWIDRQRAKGINSAVSSKHNPFSIDTFHAYVHNRRFHPSPTDLKTAWDNVQPFFDALFNNLP